MSDKKEDWEKAFSIWAADRFEKIDDNYLLMREAWVAGCEYRQEKIDFDLVIYRHY